MIGITLVVVAVLLLWRFTSWGRTLTNRFFSPFEQGASALAGDPGRKDLQGKSKPELIDQVLGLRGELERLRDADGRARILASENESLRRLLNVPEPPGYSRAVCRVISRDPVSGGRRLRVAGGENIGIKPGQAVLAEEWLMGRVLEVSKESCIVVTISDPNCKVPARIVGTNGFGVLMGEGEERWKSQPFCLLKHLPRDLEYREGAAVVTSSYSEMVPPEIPIGVLKPRGGSKLVMTIDQLYKNAWVRPKAFDLDFSVVVILVGNE